MLASKIKVLKELSIYYSNKIEQRRKIISALSYPAIVTTTAFFAISCASLLLNEQIKRSIAIINFFIRDKCLQLQIYIIKIKNPVSVKKNRIL